MDKTLFKITEEEEKKLFENGHVVFDSSALLSFYGYTDKISNEFFNKIFNALKGRLWLPAQVIYEFEKNREKVITKPRGEYHNLINSNGKKEGGFLNSVKETIGVVGKNLENIHGQINALSEKTKKDDKHPYLTQDSIKEFFNGLNEFKAHLESLSNSYEKLFADTKDQINQRIKEIDEKSESDNLRERLKTFFAHGEKYSYEKMLTVIREGKFRYENAIPPGYKDEDDKIGFQRYGDLILWFQIIDYAKGNNHPIIFVTNDVKEDWWHQENDDKTKDTPRHELLYEFIDKTGQSIWFYTTDQLIFKANLFLKTDISEAIIEEVKTANVNANEQEWLTLLQDAIENEEDVKANHRYKYKGKSLGTWLTIVAQRNKEGKKLELRAKIEEIGFDYDIKGRNPEASTKRFIKQLLSDESPNKMSYQNWFNQVIAPKKESLSTETIEELNQVWKLKFNEIRYWSIPSKIKDRVEEWKEFRYDIENNPKGKWSTHDKEMGDIYFWVLKRKKDPYFMRLIIDQFDETEIDELRSEGFPVDETED
ncbi:MAG TPA: PIN domain-containing protein [Williamwhitmania sp.]|nr:PIN domain-containing protein [Williamwhitmania sp.]